MAPSGEPDYGRLLSFRKELRLFMRWSEASARAHGLTPAQHQLLLAVKGHQGALPTIAEVADDLLLRHHSVSELIDRATAAGLIDRQPDMSDRRLARLRVTARGEALLRQLAEQHLEEIRRLGAVVRALNDA